MITKTQAKTLIDDISITYLYWLTTNDCNWPTINDVVILKVIPIKYETFPNHTPGLWCRVDFKGMKKIDCDELFKTEDEAIQCVIEMYEDEEE